MGVYCGPVFYFLLCVTSTTVLVESADNYGATILTPHIKNGNTSLAKNLSAVDPANFMGLESYAGFMTVKEKHDSNLFFWYFPHASGGHVPWVIWLEGGPGVSSLMAVFQGIGPFTIENGTLKLRDVTWASEYSLLFIDSPVGSGFSYTNDENGYTTNEDDVSDQLVELLKQFLEVFPEVRDAPLFLAGQSYAGKYVPALGSRLHRQKSDIGVNLKGIMIGNGLIDPKSQLLEGHSSLCNVLGLMEDSDLHKLKRMQRQCVEYIDQGKMIDAANKFNESIEFIKKQSGISVYDFNSDPRKAAPPLEFFVTRDDVRRWLHVGQATFDFNNQRVYQAMLPDIMNSTKQFVEELLEHYGVMVYSGQQDVILPYALAKPFHAKLRWSRREEWKNAARDRLRSSETGDVVGYRRSGGNFVEVLVRRAGHSAAHDQPEVCKFIVDTFVQQFQ